MRTYDKPDPVFGYDLDERRWTALRKDMSEIKNPHDARVGVDAADAFARAIDHPPPSTHQLDTLLLAVNSSSVTVVRNASCWLCTLAAFDDQTRQRIRSSWPSLNAKGRWGLLWAMVPRGPDMDSLFTQIVRAALQDRTQNVRSWAAMKAQQFGLQQCLPTIRQLADSEPHEESRRVFQQSADLLEHGWCFRPNQTDPLAGTMFVAAPGEGAIGFSVSPDALQVLDLASLGQLAAQAIKHPDPTTFRTFTDRFFEGNYQNLGQPAGTQ